MTGTAYTYVGSWGKQSLNDDLLGMAVLFERGRSIARPLPECTGAPQQLPSEGSPATAPATQRTRGTRRRASYASVLEARRARALEYYFLAAWQGEPGGITTKEGFPAYLERETERLTMPPRLRLKTTLSKQAKAPMTPTSALDWAKKLADSELARKTLDYRFDGWDANRRRKPKFEYDVVGPAAARLRRAQQGRARSQVRRSGREGDAART